MEITCSPFDTELPRELRRGCDRGWGALARRGALALVLALAGCSSGSASSPDAGASTAGGGSGGAAISSGASGAGVTAGAATMAGGAGGGAGTGAGAGAPAGGEGGSSGSAASSKPNLGPNVLVFDPSMPMATIQSQLDVIFNQQVLDQFGPGRYAFLFLPGQYSLDIKLGYYTQVIGLGRSPDDVVITGAVRVNDKPSTGRATGNFWRACENVSIVPSPPAKANVWAVSQGASLRRVHIKGSLALSDVGSSSGGFLADSKIDGQVTSGSQQQWLARSSEWSAWAGGVWNMVFAGVVNPPAGVWPATPYTSVAELPVIREKPFLFADAAGNYSVLVPDLRSNSQGTDWSAAPTIGTVLTLDQFYIAHPDSDTAATLNAALGQGLHLLLTPGTYSLNASLQVTKPDTLVLGLGLATLLPSAGTPALVVADVAGVKVAGVVVAAGVTNSPTLIQIGAASSAQDHSADPTLLYDISCRVGGALSSPNVAAGAASSCLTVNSNNVILDNIWLWRADHDAVGHPNWQQDQSKNGLIVNGNNVTAYGLFVEHFQEYQTLWNGDSGRVIFYQSEMPYDPTTQSVWLNGTGNGYASYKVSATVTTHEAWGLGVYCNFTSPGVVADLAFEAPTGAGIGLHHLTTVWLNGGAGTAIDHVLNGTGNAVTMAAPIATANPN
jgi:hypothetical protein